MEGEVLFGSYIPGDGEKFDEDQHSAIVGDSNLWDDLVYDRDGNIINGQTGESSSSGSSDSDTTGNNNGKNEDSGIIFEDDEAKARSQIMTVTVEESTMKEASSDDSASNVMIIVPIVIAAVLLVVAVAIIIKCYQSRTKAVMQIQENLKAVAQTESAFQDTQYQMRNDDDKSNIFSRTSTTQHKLRVADQDAVEDAFGDQHVSVATSQNGNNISSASSVAGSPETKKLNGGSMLGDNLKVKK